MQAPHEGKWWHVADAEVEELVTKLGGNDPFRPATVVVAAARPPKPRVANSPRPPVAYSPTPRVTNNSPRPHVLPGTPLMSHRSSTPRSRPSSARRSSESQKNDGKITVYVYNVHSSDKLVLRVHPDLQIGAPSSPSTADSVHNLPCYEVEGPRENMTAAIPIPQNIQPSLKSEISKALGIDSLQMRLIFHGSPLSDDARTLKCYGITDGETVHLRVHRAPCAGRNDVVLACAAKKCMENGKWDDEEKLSMRSYAMQSPAAQARLNQRCVNNGAALMPKWISQEHPKLFAPVGVSIDGQGGAAPYEAFNMKGIWHPPVDHPNHRGQNQYGFQRVREGQHANFGGA